MARASFDFVVVGGGPAGCVVASRVSEDPDCVVCLVEAGPDYGAYDEGHWPADILDARRLALDSHRWAQTNPEDRSQARARVLGGCSSHNACALVRGLPEEYDEWGPGWTYVELEPISTAPNGSSAPTGSPARTSPPGTVRSRTPAGRTPFGTPSTSRARCGGTLLSPISIPRGRGPT
jgi:choline dehydrogenase-like flavoprotein